MATDSLRSDRQPLNVLWPCTYRQDVNHDKGLIVDCRHLGLNIINSTWFPSSSTEILLDNNQLSSLDNSTFELTNDLRVLSIGNNNLHTLAANAFAGLDNLEYLNLERNKVDLDALPDDLFRDLKNLTTLKLAYTFNNISPRKWYPPNMLQGLTELRNLSLGIPGGELQFGNLFPDGCRLKELDLVGEGTKSIKNESFKCFENIPLQRLSFKKMSQLTQIESNAFQYLKHLTDLQFSETYQGISETMNSLYPFQRRNFSSLIFDRLTYKTLSNLGDNAILDSEKVKYLSQICVKRVSFLYNIIFYVDIRSLLLTPMMERCLEELAFIGSPIIKFDRTYLLQLFRMTALKSIRIENCKYPVFSNHPPKVMKGPQTDIEGNEGFKILSELLSLYGFLNNNRIGEDFYSGGNTVFIRFPPQLEHMSLFGCGTHSNKIKNIFNVSQCHNLHYFDRKDAGYEDVSGQILGCNNLEYIDMSFNNIQRINPGFFDTFPNLKTLKLKRTMINESFMLHHGQRMFSKLNLLETLDLSLNDLKSIPSDSFNSCTKLNHLNLSKTNLNSLTIDLSGFRHLQILNLAFNSITKFSHSNLQSFNQYRHREPNFTVYLEGNPFSCDCSSMSFLLWLHRTSVNLDKNGNYRCLSEDGLFVTTHSLTRNLEAMWRKCNGKYAFFISLVLWLMYILTLVLIVAIDHFKTFLVYAVFHLFAPNYKLKKKDDYQYGVFLGYEDSDYRFACFELRRFLEDQLKVTTYIRDRDLLPASDMAESIADSINASWRVVFIVSPSFLRLESWNYFTVKSAIYSVSPFNPKKIVLLADKDIVHRIPDSLLKVIPEDNIIEMEMPFGLAYEEQETLRNIIL